MTIAIKFPFIVFIALIGYNTPILAQDVNINLIGKKFSEAVINEVKNDGKVYTSDDDIIIPGGMAEPMVYTRAGKDVKAFFVEYTFGEKDSIIRRIEYKWGEANDKNMLNEKFKLFLRALNEKYGQSKAVSQYQHYWVTTDKMEVALYGNFTTNPMVTVQIRKDNL